MALLVEIKVVPSSGKSECILDKQGALKCYLKSEAEKGKANKELIVLLAKKLKLTQENVEIISGQTSRKKLIKIHSAIDKAEFMHALGLELQKTIIADQLKR